MADPDFSRPLGELARALRELHRALVDAARAAHEQAHGPVPTAVAMFHLLSQDPRFAWLRSLSELMVEIDELLDDAQPPEAVDAAAVRSALELLFAPPAETPFSREYHAFLQSQIEVIGAHADVRRRLAQLPAPSADDASAHAAARERRAAARRKPRRPLN